MISLAGEPYTALPTAFRYRKAYDPECKCGQIEAPPPPAFALTDQFSAQYSDPWKFARGTNPLALPEDQPPIPLWRPEAGEDPETLANRGGRFKPERVETEEETVTGIPTHNENSVRIVGPVYFFAQ